MMSKYLGVKNLPPVLEAEIPAKCASDRGMEKWLLARLFFTLQLKPGDGLDVKLSFPMGSGLSL